MEKTVKSLAKVIENLSKDVDKYDSTPNVQRALINAVTLLCCAVDYIRTVDSLKPKFDVTEKTAVTIPKADS